MPKATVFEAQQWAFSFIQDQPAADQEGVKLLLRTMLGYDQTQYLMNLRTELTPKQYQAFKAAVTKYAQGYPVQYILGQADFFGLTLKVTADTLIPRVETQDLVELILSQHSESQLKVADIGTGTGAIGLALKANRPDWQVTLTDLSPQTLAVAQENARNLNLDVIAKPGDLLAPLVGQKYHLLVSNPPYIAEEEESVMDQSVIDYEPHLALFAEDGGLAIYKRLAQELTLDLLEPQAHLYLEIGYQQGPAVKALFEAHFPQAKVEIYQDLAGKDRMIEVAFNN
ncbi:peptide chain release factor N(5)-glutamine methyltransferase [Ligilactobacillus equi]|nr:peptide chain release factor N(5)-glutamine methyltransferase [Ligilactobacillus sp.]